MRRNNSKKIIYVSDGNREEEIYISLNETVLDLKKKIEQKFHLGNGILKGKNIRKKGLKDRTSPIPSIIFLNFLLMTKSV